MKVQQPWKRKSLPIPIHYYITELSTACVTRFVAWPIIAERHQPAAIFRISAPHNMLAQVYDKAPPPNKKQHNLNMKPKSLGDESQQWLWFFVPLCITLLQECFRKLWIGEKKLEVSSANQLAANHQPSTKKNVEKIHLPTPNNQCIWNIYTYIYPLNYPNVGIII